jgi:hypothetical protein
MEDANFVERTTPELAARVDEGKLRLSNVEC